MKLYQILIGLIIGLGLMYFMFNAWQPEKEVIIYKDKQCEKETLIKECPKYEEQLCEPEYIDLTDNSAANECYKNLNFYIDELDGCNNTKQNLKINLQICHASIQEGG